LYERIAISATRTSARKSSPFQAAPRAPIRLETSMDSRFGGVLCDRGLTRRTHCYVEEARGRTEPRETAKARRIQPVRRSRTFRAGGVAPIAISSGGLVIRCTPVAGGYVNVMVAGPHAALWIVLNPRASSAGDVARARIEAALPGCRVIELAEGDDPRSAVRTALDAGARAVVAAGGDGTVSAVAAELVGRSTRLGIIPCGTSNSVASALGIPDTLEAACAVAAGEHARMLDTATVNGKPMLLMASIGLHARAVTDTSDEAKAAFGALAYVTSGAWLLLGSDPFDVEVLLDESAAPIRASVHALTVANIAPPRTVLAQGPPEVCPDDGLLDVTLVAFDGVLDAIAAALHLYRNALEGLPATRDGVAFARARRVRVRATPEQALMVDGEACGHTPFDVQCRPQTLSVLVPDQAPPRSAGSVPRTD
jgi:YegS/Rv2252/BmrU family lipid kinase